MSFVVLTLLLSTALCGGYLWLARRRGILDRPNERSSHQRPTPHGGGLPLLLAFYTGCLLAAWQAGVTDRGYALILVTSMGLLAVGVLDDLRGLSVRLRFGLYALGCLLVAAGLLIPALSEVPLAGVLVVVAATALALLWALNLYNFMDGIDGLAASQCLLACVGAALLGAWSAASAGYVLVLLLLAAAQGGFLVWNWPPARLFMGDAGSVPTGFLLAALALLGALRGELPLACWLILLAPFVIDASWTLVWRVLTGQPFLRPHRLHAYQRLSRHWGGHRPVVLLLYALVIAWLLPLAALAVQWPHSQLLLVILAYFPLLAGMAKATKLA